jgi:lysophospholipase L1-like esterase
MELRRVPSILVLILAFSFFGCENTDSDDSELCFVGDSITHLWDLEYYFPTFTIHKHAVSGAVLADVATWNTSDCKGIPVVFLIGTNDLWSGMDNDTLTESFIQDFTGRYVEQARLFSASKLFAVSLIPRTVKKDTEKINTQIRLLNQRLHKALDTSKIPYKFIDVQSEFLDTDTKIHDDYYSDGLHLSQEGYETLSQKISEAL